MGDKGDKFLGVVSLLTGFMGASVPYFLIDPPWGGIVGFMLFLCVAMSHNWLATGKI